MITNIMIRRDIQNNNSVWYIIKNTEIQYTIDALAQSKQSDYNTT